MRECLCYLAQFLKDAAHHRDQNNLIVVSVEKVKYGQGYDRAHVIHSFTECVKVGKLIDPPTKYPLEEHHLHDPVPLGCHVHDEDDQDHGEDVDVLVTGPLHEGGPE